MNKFFKSASVQWLIFAACSASIFAAFWFTSRLDENKEDATSASENETEEVVRCLPPDAVTTNSFFGYRFGSELSNVDAIICKISRLGGGVEPVSSQTVSGLPTGLDKLSNGKSLSNLVELPLLGAACGVCYGIRVFLGFLYPKITNFFWSVLTIPLMLAVAILWALYFPTLPE